MRRSASEILRNLEMRVARLEKQSADKNYFEMLWNEREKTKKHSPSLSYGKGKGGRYLSAIAGDMEIFLQRNGFDIDRFKGISRNEVLYIIEDNHTARRDEVFVFVVKERMIKYPSHKRTGWRIYR